MLTSTHNSLIIWMSVIALVLVVICISLNVMFLRKQFRRHKVSEHTIEYRSSNVNESIILIHRPIYGIGQNKMIPFSEDTDKLKDLRRSNKRRHRRPKYKRINLYERYNEDNKGSASFEDPKFYDASTESNKGSVDFEILKLFESEGHSERDIGSANSGGPQVSEGNTERNIESTKSDSPTLSEEMPDRNRRSVNSENTILSDKHGKGRANSEVSKHPEKTFEGNNGSTRDDSPNLFDGPTKRNNESTNSEGLKLLDGLAERNKESANSKVLSLFEGSVDQSKNVNDTEGLGFSEISIEPPRDDSNSEGIDKSRGSVKSIEGNDNDDGDADIVEDNNAGAIPDSQTANNIDKEILKSHSKKANASTDQLITTNDLQYFDFTNKRTEHIIVMVTILLSILYLVIFSVWSLLRLRQSKANVDEYPPYKDND